MQFLVRVTEQREYLVDADSEQALRQRIALSGPLNRTDPGVGLLARHDTLDSIEPY